MPLTKLRILTYRMTGAERRFSLRILVALSSLPLFGVVAAFGLAPDTTTTDITPETITEAIALPTLAGAANSGTFERETVIQSGDTLASALGRLKIDALEIKRLLATDAVRQLATNKRAGKHIQETTTPDGQLLSIRIDRRDGPTLTVLHQGDSYIAQDSSDQVESREVLRRGDTFSVIYPGNYRNGEPISTGNLLAAEVVNAGKAYRVVLYRDASGHESYYTPEGLSQKIFYLRSPLEFSRVTSNFSSSRMHPVLGYARAHTGGDFGAPTGTRVKATGDATVEFAGRRGGYGNLVIQRHQNGYETYYGHLSAFAPGIRRGRAVSQGDIIAYVGATGVATGPHLHYEVRIAGKPYNPLSVKLPGSPPLAAAQRARFLQQTASWSEKLGLLRGTNLAALD